MHILPQLRKLEERYVDEVVVLGVHSAKFTAERGTEALRQAVLRYDIRHPVANDRDFAVWQRYAARAWPSLFFIDPQGLLVGKHEGEYRFEDLDNFLGPLVKQYSANGALHPRPSSWRLERGLESAQHEIAFPGKVLADEGTDRLFIADSGHNRLLVTSLNGDVKEIIGQGDPGLVDADFGTTQFSNPQGLALDSGTLYVADKENHAIRQIDLVNKRVVTLAGTGNVGMTLSEQTDARKISLRSPWDVEIVDGVLYIAMAGMHQLWSLDLHSTLLSPYAGNGRESLSNGPLMQSELAQPSGLVSNGGETLFFVDSETSSVRSASTNPAGNVETLVGTGLFDFGDRDGVGDTVLLQHPQGLCFANGFVYVADSYNNRIKRLDPASREIISILGDGQEGATDGNWEVARFFEPSDVSVVGNRMYIADTNNHAIRIADLKSGVVSTLVLNGL